MGKSPISPQIQRPNRFHSKSPSPLRHFSRSGSTNHTQNIPNASFLRRVGRKIAIIFTVFAPKSKRVAVPKDDVPAHDHGYGGQSANEVEESYFGLSAGSKSGASSYGKQNNSFGSSSSVNAHIGSVKFSLQDILKATNNFSKETIIGEGGFATVYKGQLRDGCTVAIKRAKSTLLPKRSGEEFKNEILALSKVEHLNLVRLYGYLEQKGEMIIMVEYVDSGSLLEHLDGTRGNGLELAQRLDIATDVAHAIAYLHNYNDPPIIHRDIKSSNVLITKKFRAKVADFGLARIFPEDELATHISTQIKGTAGYLDPEYLKTNQLTEKSDVYSYGVLLVELVTGRRPLEPKRGLKERLTTKWAMQALKQDAPVIAMDPRLRRSPASISAVERMLKLAQKCLASFRPSRPSMKECVEELWVIRKEYREQAKLNCTSRRSADFAQVDARMKCPKPSESNKGENFVFVSA